MSGAKGDVTIEMRFVAKDHAGAVAIARKVHSVNEKGLKRVNKQSNVLGLSMRKLGRSVAFGVAGFAGVAGVSGILGGLAQGVSQFINKRSEFEKVMTPLLSLGNNIDKIDEMKNKVLSLGLSYNRTNQEVADFLFNIKSTTGNLTLGTVRALTKETLELGDATGGRLLPASNLMVKSFQIYGKEIKTVNQLQNKLLLTQDQAAITFDELATRLPDVLTAAKTAGFTLDEVLGATIGSTKLTGSIEKGMTGMRNFFLILKTAKKKGTEFTGTFIEQLGQVRDMFGTDIDRAIDLFGKEVVNQAKNAADAYDDISDSIQRLGKISEFTDTALEKLQKRWSDPSFAESRFFDAMDRAIEDAPLRAGKPSSDLTQIHATGRLGAVAYANMTEGKYGPIGTGIGYSSALINPMLARQGFEVLASLPSTDSELFRNMMLKKFEVSKGKKIAAAEKKVNRNRLFLRRNPTASRVAFDKSNEVLERISNAPVPMHLRAQAEVGGDAGFIARMESRRAKGFDVDEERVSAARERISDLPESEQIAQTKRTNELLEELLLLSRGSKLLRPAPGGSKANATEGGS